jgi:fucose 4-O-acetylase-like acetyltransferase
MQKDSTITIAKAIAIILMVFGHTWVSEYVNRWVGWFHMPLFFFMSGLCFKDGNLKAPWSYVKKKVKGIYVPFVKWSLIFLLLHNVFFNLNIYNDEYGYKGEVSYYYSITDFISHSIQIITKMSGNPQLLGGYWFLETLFVASVGLLVFLIVLNRLEKLLRLNNKILIHLLGG